MLRQFIGAAAASLVLCMVVPAAAQDVPAYAQPVGSMRLVGTIVRFAPGSYELGLLDDRGRVDRIALHQGTILIPTGVDLTPGMRVSIVGHDAGTSFVANEIVRVERDRRGGEPAWYARWVAPGAASVQNPPAPPIVQTPFR